MMNIMMMRNILMGCLFFLLATALSAQIPEVDKSPLDFSYAPANYPILKFQGKQVPAAPLARVIYSRPQRNGRQLFGSEIKYGEIWRLGANETTEIEFFRNVNFAGKNISKGRYSLYCIPQADRWTIILNKDLHTWGAFSYKQSADAVRVNVPVTKTNGSMVEYFTMVFNESNHLVIQWSDVKVVVPIGYSGKLN
jgi:hypothetical protein